MALSVDWVNRIISVPKADLQLVQSVPTEIRQLDIDAFRLELKALEDDVEGVVFVDTHRHVGPVTVGGVTLARVVEIINNYTVTFEDGQYAVNLVGANSNIGDVVNVNQVSVRSSNSAGLTFSDQINDQSFQGFVWINTDIGGSGIQFPRGTFTDPSDNWPDATAIALQRNIGRFHLFGSITPATDLGKLSIIGEDTNLADVDLSSATGTAKLNLEKSTVTGSIVSGPVQFLDCVVNSVTGFDGQAHGCALSGTITLDATTTRRQRFISCYSDVPGTSKPILNVNGAPCDISVRDYTGGLLITNFSQAGQNMSIDVDSGTIELDATCTAGTINVRGMAQLIDNSGPGCTVVTDGTVTNLVAAGTVTEQDKDDIAGRVIPHIWASS